MPWAAAELHPLLFLQAVSSWLLHLTSRAFLGVLGEDRESSSLYIMHFLPEELSE